MCVCVFRCDGVPRSLSLLDASAMAVPLLPLCSLFPPPVLSTAGPSKKGQHNCQNRKRTNPTLSEKRNNPTEHITEKRQSPHPFCQHPHKHNTRKYAVVHTWTNAPKCPLSPPPSVKPPLRETQQTQRKSGTPSGRESASRRPPPHLHNGND